MKQTAHDEMISLASQLHVHPDIEGLNYIEQKIESVANKANMPVPNALKQFLAGMRSIRSDQTDAALGYYLECIALVDSKDYVLSALAHMFVATLYDIQGNNPLALKHFKAALENEHRLDHGTLSWVLVNVSAFYLSLEQYQQALEAATTGADLSAVSFNDYNHCICKLNIGYSLTCLGHANEALESLNDALAIGQKSQNSFLLAICHSYLGMALTDAAPSEFEQARQHFEQARKHYIDAYSKSDEIDSELAYASLLNKHCYYSDALGVCANIESSFANQVSERQTIKRLEIQSTALEGSSRWQELALNERRLRSIVAMQLEELKQNDNERIVNAVDDISKEQERVINSKVFENLDAINAIGQLIATSSNLSATLPSIFEQVRSVFPTFVFGIALYDETTHILDYCHYYDENGYVAGPQVDCRTAGNIGAFVVNNLQTVHLNNVSHETLSQFMSREAMSLQSSTEDDPTQCRSMLATPILLKEQILGVLTVQSLRTNQYHTHHKRLFEQLAHFIAISLNNLQQKANLVIANRQLEKLSRTDPLTGLQNRHQLSELYHQLIESSIASRNPFILALIDIDHYKAFNDSFGHQSGDKALMKVAALLADTFDKEHAHLFRYGGDEFLLLISAEDKDCVESRLTELLNNCRDLELDTPGAQLTLSIGAVFCPTPNHQHQFDELFDVADKSLYRVKRRGRDGLEITTLTEMSG